MAFLVWLFAIVLVRLRNHYLLFLTSSLNSSIFRTVWKLARVYPVLKKGDASDLCIQVDSFSRLTIAIWLIIEDRR